MQFVVLSIFVVVCLMSLVRPHWALALVLLMYPFEQSLQASVPVFRAIPPLANVCIALVAGIAAIYAIARQERPFAGYFTGVFWCTCWIFGWSVLSLIWTPSHPQADEMVKSGIPYFVLFILVSPFLLDGVDDYRRLGRALLLLGCIVAGTIILNPEFNFRYGRLGIDLEGNLRTNPLTIGELGGTILIVAALMRTEVGEPFWSALRFVSIPLGAALAFQSGSRGQILFAGIVAVAMYPLARQLRSVFSFLGTVVAVAVIGGAVLLVAQLVLEGDLLRRWDANALAEGGTTRIWNIMDLVRAYAVAPGYWLFGLGFNAFSTVSAAIHEPYSHALTIDMLCELGMLTFAAYLASIAWTYRSSRELFARAAADPGTRADVTIFLALAVYQLLLNNKQGTLWASGPMFLHFLIIVRAQRREALLAPLAPPADAGHGDDALPHGAHPA